MPKLYCSIDLNHKEKEYLELSLNSIEINYSDQMSEKDSYDSFLAADICFGNIPANWLEATANLKWIQLESVGFGEYQNLKPKTDFVITNLKGFFSKPVAETVLAGVLALYRGIDQLTILKKNKTWVGEKLRPQLRLLHDTQVLLLGGGTIGQELAKLLTAFDCSIVIYDRFSNNADIRQIDQLDHEISKSDIVVSCLPETNETMGLLNKERLALMKSSAIFANVGRGSVVDEDALCNALKEERIGGCVIDVTKEEPIAPWHAIWSCPNAIVTQHTGGGYGDEIMGKVKLFLQNYSRYNAQTELMNVVDLQKGY